MACVVSVSALAFVALAGCGESDETSAPQKAAEPADSPPLAAKPAGTVTKLGTSPEGLVADPGTGLLAAAVSDPPSLALYRTRDAKLVKTVALPSAPRHLSIAGPGGPVLVPAEDANQLVTVALPSGSKTAVQTGRHPHDATFTRGEAFVSDEYAGLVTVIKGRKAVGTVDTGGQPGGIASSGSTVAVVDVRDRLIRFLAAPGGDQTGTLPGGAGPTHAATDAGGTLYVVDTQGDAILRYALDPTPKLLGRTALPGSPYGIAIDRAHHRLWVTQTARNRVVELQASESGLTAVRSYPTVRQPNSVAVDSRRGVVFVAGNEAGLLQRIDVGTAR